MIDMAHGLGLTRHRRGRRNGAQARYLMDLDCDSLQGFLFFRPRSRRPALQPALDRSAAGHSPRCGAIGSPGNR